MGAPWLAHHSRRVYAFAVGLFFSAVALAGMFLPVVILPGVQIDGRVVVVAVASAHGGPLAALIAPVLPVVYRLYLGGVGSLPGVAALVGAGAVGAIFRRTTTRPTDEWALSQRLLLGLMVASQALLWSFALPMETALRALELYFLPVLITYPAGCALLGTLLAHQDQRHASAARLRQEIEQKERTEVSLRESEARFRLLAENIQEVFWIRDAATDELTYVSPAYETIWGRKAVDLYRNQQEWTEAIEEQYRGEVLRTVESHRTEEFEIEFVVVRPDGERRWIRARGFPVHEPSGGVSRIVGIAEDITRRKASEAALLRHQERLGAIIENSVDGICVALRGQVVLVNPAFVALVGACNEEALLNRPLLDWAQPSTRIAITRLLDDCDHPRAWMTTVTHQLPDKSPRSLDVRLARYGTEGEYTLLLIRDVTAQNRLEEQLRQSQKMEAIGQLAGGIAHDFNNLLTVIGGHAQLMQMTDLAPPNDESVAEILKAVERAKQLVAQILAFSRKQPARRQLTPLAPIVDEVMALLRATIPSGIELVKTVAPDLKQVMCDPSQVHQMLLNLGTNAWQAVSTVKRPGRIEVRLENVLLGPDRPPGTETLPSGWHVRMSVMDNGPGMDPETAARIFEPFFTTKAPGAGTGLGLSVVHNIVEAHRGAVHVESQVDEGTTMSVYLPAADGRLVSAGADRQALPQGQAEHILYLDDEEALVIMTTRLLERLGYRVSPFTRVRDALAAFTANPRAYDLVVTDMNMPERSGIEVAETILRVRPELPVIITSGHVTEEMKRRAESLGVKELFYKPGTAQEFATALRRSLTVR